MVISYSFADYKPNLTNLYACPYIQEGNRNIVARSASKYKCIGTILLKDEDGTIVSGLTASQQPRDVMHTIFEKWVQEDTECSWHKLTQCMRQCELSSLAQEIEEGLQINPHLSRGIMVYYSLCLYQLFIFSKALFFVQRYTH